MTMTCLTASQSLFRRFALAVLVPCTLPFVAMAQDANSPPRQLILVDPTPRPPDLQREYSNDPVRAKQQQDLIMLKNQLRAREIWLDANKLLLLAQELKADVATHEKGSAMMSNANKAGEIEKLAKGVKEKLKER